MAWSENHPETAQRVMLVKSTHEGLRPDIYIRVGKEPVPCQVCEARAIYQYGEMIVCRTCGTRLQLTLNRLKDR